MVHLNVWELCMIQHFYHGFMKTAHMPLCTKKPLCKLEVVGAKVYRKKSVFDCVGLPSLSINFLSCFKVIHQTIDLWKYQEFYGLKPMNFP